MIGEIKQRLLEQVTPKTNLRAAYVRLKMEVAQERETRAEPGPVVSADVTAAEFRKRYTFLVYSIVVISVALCLSLMQLFVAESVLSVCASSLVAILALLMMVVKAYRAWLARYVWRRWDDRQELLLPPLSAFLDAVGSDPKEALPYGLNPSERGSVSKRRKDRG